MICFNIGNIGDYYSNVFPIFITILIVYFESMIRKHSNFKYNYIPNLYIIVKMSCNPKNTQLFAICSVFLSLKVTHVNTGKKVAGCTVKSVWGIGIA